MLMVVWGALAAAMSVGGGGGGGAVTRIVGVRPDLAMLSGLTARVAFLEGIWGRQGVADRVLSAPG